MNEQTLDRLASKLTRVWSREIEEERMTDQTIYSSNGQSWIDYHAFEQMQIERDRAIGENIYLREQLQRMNEQKLELLKEIEALKKSPATS